MCNTDRCCSVKTEGTTEISENRRCTDIIFLLAFIVSWGIMFIIFQQAGEMNADPDKLLHAVNMQGKICGVDPGFKNTPYGAWPNPIYYQPKICVANCDATNDPDNKFMAYNYESYKWMSYCVPDLIGNGTVNVEFSGFNDKFSDGGELAARSVGDLWTAMPVIMGSALVALVMTFVFVGCLKYIAGCLVYMCLFFLVVGGGTIGYTLFSWGSAEDSSLSEATQKACRYLGIAILVADFVFVVVMCFLSQQIRIAIAVVKQAAKAIEDMKSIIFFPIFPMVVAVGYVAFWMYVALFIYSVSELQEQIVPDSVREYQGSHPMAGQPNSNPEKMLRYQPVESFRAAIAFHIFHLLWVLQFLFYFGYLVFAGATADWYFTPWNAASDKVRGEGPGMLTKSPISASCIRTTRYHTGTVATASFIIATIQFIRLCILYLEKKTKGDPPSQFQAILFKCLHCCLKCVECFMDKVNKNALIWTAIYGDDFCTSACSSFALVWRNLARVAAVSVVSTLVLAIGKVCVAIMTVGVMGMFMINVSPFKEDLSSPFAPCMVIFVLSYCIADLFFVVFQATIDTMFVCFLIDAETNGPGSMLAHPDLQELVGQHSESSAAKAKAANKARQGRPGVEKGKYYEMSEGAAVN